MTNNFPSKLSFEILMKNSQNATSTLIIIQHMSPIIKIQNI